MILSLLGALACCAAAALLSETAARYFITGTDLVRRKRSVLVNTGKALEKAGTFIVLSDKDEKVAKPSKTSLRLRRELMIAFQQLQRANLKGHAICLGTHLLVLLFLGPCFDGVPVAKLPFTPFDFMYPVTMRGLDEGSDPTQCSFTFLLLLSAFCFRPIVKRLFGNDAPRLRGLPNMFGIPISEQMQRNLTEAQASE